MRRLALLAAAAFVACNTGSTPPPQQPPPGWQQPPPQGWQQPPPQGWQQPPPGWQQQPPPGWPPQQPPPGWQAQPAPTVQPQPVPTVTPPAQRPLLAPLVGAPAQQAEVKAILDELIRNLQPQYQQKVSGIPLQFEQTAEVNAYAGCDEQGRSYMAGTSGLLDAVDAIAQTNATDELFGTKTYEAYVAAVVPKMMSKTPQSPALPLGTIPPQYALDVRRLSRAHELFDDVIAFTFGHELAHHYLGHTGCANGDQKPPATLEDVAKLLARGASRVPLFNQPNEVAADNWGVIDVLDSGKRRQPQYRWTEKGGMLLLDFFARLEQAAGMNNLLVAFLVSHPNSRLRMGVVQNTAQTWWAQNR